MPHPTGPMSALLKTFLAIAIVTVVTIATTTEGTHAQVASPNDTARLLAGMLPPPDSPLSVLTRDRTWQEHANHFNSIFAKLKSQQLNRIQTWSRARLTSPSPVLFYMFSGPDFLYANAFFPNTSTYVMSGLEPVGPLPDMTKLSREARTRGYRNIEQSLRSIISYGFFKTIDMRYNLAATGVTGTLPIIYVFLARSGKTIRDVSLIRLDQNGTPSSSSRKLKNRMVSQSGVFKPGNRCPCRTSLLQATPRFPPQPPPPHRRHHRGLRSGQVRR